MRRRLFILFFLAPLCLGLMTAQKNNKNTNVKTIKIGLIGKSQSNPVFMAAYAGARVAAKEIGAKYNVDVVIDWQTPKNEDAQEQVQAVDQMSRSGVAGIAIACSDAKILTPSINQAVDLGTQVVCFDADAPKSKRFAYYGTDDVEFGKMMMKELAQEMNETGVIAMIAGNKNAPNLQRRVRTIIEELKKYPSMKLLPNGVYYHDEIPERAAGVVARAQKENPQIRGWAFVGGWPLFMKNGISWAPGKIKVVACDALPDELEYVHSGQVQVLLAQGCFSWGYKSVELLLDKILMNQSPKEEFIAAPLTRVTKENYEEWSLNWKKWLIKEAVNR